MVKILLVEDEENIREFLKINLERNDFKVIETETGEEGIRQALLEKPDVAILDVMLPGIDGFEVCKTLRKEFDTMGIIILTAKGQDTDKIMGLERGADDYIIKPFNPLEVVLRVKALLRRINHNANKDNVDENKLKGGPYVIDLYSKKLLRDNIEIDLTPTEYNIMKLFLENPNRAFKRDELLNIIWGYDFIGDPKIIDVNIKRLRKKLGEDTSSGEKFIETVWGIGYRWRGDKNEV